MGDFNHTPGNDENMPGHSKKKQTDANAIKTELLFPAS